jgi:hypothetical protein
VTPHEICNQAADALNAIVHSYHELYSLRHTHAFIPYMSLASSIVYLAVSETQGYQINSIFSKILQGASYLHEMMPSHAFAGRGEDKLRRMAKRLIVGAGWLQDNEQDPDKGSVDSFNGTKSILPRRLIALESSIFSPYPRQVLARVDGIKQLRVHGFELSNRSS